MLQFLQANRKIQLIISKDSLTKLLMDTILKIAAATDIKETIMPALSAMLVIIQNVLQSPHPLLKLPGCN